jgi:hypothetical protein
MKFKELFKCNIEYSPSAKSVNITHATQDDLNAYKWPDEGVKSICVSYSMIDNFVIPEGVETFSCVKCLKTVVLPDSLKYLYLEDTMVHSLDLPLEIERVWVPHNYIREVTFRGGNQPLKLECLNLKSNLLEKLDIEPPDTLYEMDLRKNNLVLSAINPNLLVYARTREGCIIDFY